MEEEAEQAYDPVAISTLIKTATDPTTSAEVRVNAYAALLDFCALSDERKQFLTASEALVLDIQNCILSIESEWESDLFYTTLRTLWWLCW